MHRYSQFTCVEKGVLATVLTALIVVSVSANGFQNTAYSIGADYIIRTDGKHNIAVNKEGTTVLKVAQNDKSRDIIQAVHDLLASEKGALGGTISVESGSYPVHKPMIFKIPIILLMDGGTILKFDHQRRGDVGILTTTAKATIEGGVFDCNKAVQTEYWIHGIVIDVGSEGSVIKNVEAKNCSLYGNGFVMLANYSTLTDSVSHHNDGDGVYLRSCDYCTVQNSWFNYNKFNGVDASDQDGKLAGHSLIHNNTAMWNLDGINLDTTYHANVTQNYLNGNWIGIAEYHSTADNLHNLITNNIIKNSPQWGIYEQEYIPWHDPYVSDYSIITGNMMVSNGHENVIKTESMHTMVANNTFVD